MKRQAAQNLVYLPVTSTYSFSGYMTGCDATDHNQADRWQLHIQAVAEHKDKQAFHALYVYFAPKINAFFCQQGMSTYAEEITHEAFMRIWRKASSYQADKAQVSTWIFTIVRNLKIDFLRKQKFMQPLDEASTTQAVYQFDKDADYLSLNKKLKKSFRLLTQEQKNVLQKVYFEDKSHQIAANELEMTPGVVKSRIRSALKLLRSDFGQSNEESVK